MRGVLASIFGVERQYVFYIFYVVCFDPKLSGMQNARGVLKSVICPAVTFFRTNIIEYNTCVSILCKILSETFLILRRINWDIIINLHNYSCKVPFFCQILMNLKFSRQMFEKYSYIKFHGNLSSGSRVVSWGWTGRHDEANSCFSQFCSTRLKIRKAIRLSHKQHVVLPWATLSLKRCSYSIVEGTWPDMSRI